MTDFSQQTDKILRVNNLRLAYGDYEVLKGVSFHALRGECLIVMGGSGCGKSTLLKSMVGLLEPLDGEITVDSQNIWSLDVDVQEAVLRKFGVLFQQVNQVQSYCLLMRFAKWFGVSLPEAYFV